MNSLVASLAVQLKNCSSVFAHRAGILQLCIVPDDFFRQRFQQCQRCRTFLNKIISLCCVRKHTGYSPTAGERFWVDLQHFRMFDLYPPIISYCNITGSFPLRVSAAIATIAINLRVKKHFVIRRCIHRNQTMPDFSIFRFPGYKPAKSPAERLVPETIIQDFPV